MRALWLGPAARRALRPGVAGTVEIALARGGYVRLGDDWLLLAPPRAPLAPLSVLVEGLGQLAPGDPVQVVPGERSPGAPARPHDVELREAIERGPTRRRPAIGSALLVGGARIDLGGARVTPSVTPAPLHGAWRPALAAARAVCPAPPGLEDGVAALRRGAVGEAVAALAGRGPGLTPAGDDVLAGFAGWRHAAGAPVALAGLAAGRGSPIGLAYLRCAERGELPDPARSTLDAVRGGDPRLAARRARVLARWGATSGGAMLYGMAAAAGDA